MGTGTGRIEGDGQRDKRDQVRLRREAEKMPANMDTEQVSEREQPKSFVQKWISAFDPSIASAIFFNFFTSTGIVSANKFVYQQCNFTYATTLTFIHFIFTTLGLLFCLQVHLFEFKKLDIKKSSWLAFVGMGFVVFSNLSLQYNSLGFYQVMKHMTVAAVVVIEAVVYKKYLDKELVIPLLLVIAGVSLTGATDFKLNMIGVVFAVLNILCTSFYQIWCASLQKSLEANALQLQLYTAPLSALFIIPFVPILDNLSLSDSGSLFQFEMTARTANRAAYLPLNIAIGFNVVKIAIAITGVLAFGVNVSIFMVIGKTSAVTYNVLGHFKTCTLLSVDYLFFGRPFDIKNFTGIVITLCGVVSYSHIKMLKSQKKPQETPQGSERK